MQLKEAIQYLRPIADSASLPRYIDALNTGISAMEELEFTRKFIHDQGLEFALMSEWSRKGDLVGRNHKNQNSQS